MPGTGRSAINFLKPASSNAKLLQTVDWCCLRKIATRARRAKCCSSFPNAARDAARNKQLPSLGTLITLKLRASNYVLRLLCLLHISAKSRFSASALASKLDLNKSCLGLVDVTRRVQRKPLGSRPRRFLRLYPWHDLAKR